MATIVEIQVEIVNKCDTSVLVSGLSENPDVLHEIALSKIREWDFENDADFCTIEMTDEDYSAVLYS